MFGAVVSSLKFHSENARRVNSDDDNDERKGLGGRSKSWYKRKSTDNETVTVDPTVELAVGIAMLVVYVRGQLSRSAFNYSKKHSIFIIKA